MGLAEEIVTKQLCFAVAVGRIAVIADIFQLEQVHDTGKL